jgi:hypothetical protein
MLIRSASRMRFRLKLENRTTRDVAAHALNGFSSAGFAAVIRRLHRHRQE